MVYVIAEAGLNHNGSMTLAKKLIDGAVEAGCDAVKFQKRTVDILAAESVLNAKDDRFPEFGSTYRAIREFLEFNERQYEELLAYTKGNGIDFLVTAFDIPAAETIRDLGCESVKIASHGMTNIPLLEFTAKSFSRVFYSVGMTEITDINIAEDIFAGTEIERVLLHCVSSYPCSPEECNLGMIPWLRRKYGGKVGYSGHELGFYPTLAAVSLGAEVVERHYTIDKNLPGFDHHMSLDFDELAMMVKGIREIERATAYSEKKITDVERITQRKYHVSLCSNKQLKKGHLIQEQDLCLRNPGIGVLYRNRHELIGKKLKSDWPACEVIPLDAVE